MAFVIPLPRNSFHLYENIPQKKTQKKCVKQSCEGEGV